MCGQKLSKKRQNIFGELEPKRLLAMIKVQTSGRIISVDKPEVKGTDSDL